jgi:hypothetical protein
MVNDGMSRRVQRGNPELTVGDKGISLKTPAGGILSVMGMFQQLLVNQCFFNGSDEQQQGRK